MNKSVNPISCSRTLFRRAITALAWAVTLTTPLPGEAQDSRGSRDGSWTYIGADASNTRYSDLDQVNADNFEDP